jgi:hypothetical protein
LLLDGSGLPVTGDSSGAHLLRNTLLEVSEFLRMSQQKMDDAEVSLAIFLRYLVTLFHSVV